MDRSVLLVDVGYLLAEGGKAYCGAHRRSQIACDYSGVSVALQEWVRLQGSLPLLRAYWFDGAEDGVLSLDQQEIGALPRVKLRLGRLVPRRGGVEQKGVDSLIVHDLITLAHERAAATMFLLAGDEDLREGVAAAQRLGVQVILVGIKTSAARNQSLPLIREADEHIMLDPSVLAEFFSRAGAAAEATVVDPADLATRAAGFGSAFALEWVAGSDAAQVAELVGRYPEIPRELDVQMLVRLEEQLGRSLRGDQPTRHALRAAFWESLRGQQGDQADPGDSSLG